MPQRLAVARLSGGLLPGDRPILNQDLAVVGQLSALLGRQFCRGTTQADNHYLLALETMGLFRAISWYRANASPDRRSGLSPPANDLRSIMSQ